MRKVRLSRPASCGLAGGNFEQPLESLKKTPTFVFVSKKCSTYPTWEKSGSDSSGWVGENRYASGVFSPAASLTTCLSNRTLQLMPTVACGLRPGVALKWRVRFNDFLNGIFKLFYELFQLMIGRLVYRYLHLCSQGKSTVR